MKIAILDDYANVALKLADWSGLGEITVFSDTISDEAALIARLAPFDIVCLMRERTPMPASVINALPNLKLIVTTGPRNASVDMAAARARSIPVCGTLSRKTTTAEMTLLLMLALNRRLVPEIESLKKGTWQAGLGRDLAGLRLGLIGLGTIGGQMAALGQALGMEISAWSQNLTEARAAECGARKEASLHDLMAVSDVVSIHLILSNRNRGLVDKAAFAAMKEGAVFINTSRAGLVDTKALIDGLKAQKPFMAGIDVFDTEPLPANDPINDLALQAEGRLLLTPHLGYTTHANFEQFYRQTAEAVRGYLSGNLVRVIE